MARARTVVPEPSVQTTAERSGRRDLPIIIEML
jgi:hypothetical protein